MKVKYCNKQFSEVKNGETFLCGQQSEQILMKITSCKEDDTSRNVVRLEDGKLFHFDGTEIVFPVNCVIMRNA